MLIRRSWGLGNRLRVVLQLDDPEPRFERGQQIPIYDIDGDLADYAEVLASFSDGTLILELPDNDAGRIMFQQMAREVTRTREISDLERLFKS